MGAKWGARSKRSFWVNWKITKCRKLKYFIWAVQIWYKIKHKRLNLLLRSCFFVTVIIFFSEQLGHPKLSCYRLLSTQALQNRSQEYSSVSQSGATAFPWRDPEPPAASRPKGVNIYTKLSTNSHTTKLQLGLEFTSTGVSARAALKIDFWVCSNYFNT